MSDNRIQHPLKPGSLLAYYGDIFVVLDNVGFLTDNMYNCFFIRGQFTMQKMLISDINAFEALSVS